MTTNEGGMVTEENEGIINGIQRSVTSDNLIGFIYLDDAPKNPTSSNNISSNTNNTSSNNTNTQPNVDEVIDVEEEKSSNNYLSELTIDIENFNFDKNTTEYTLAVGNNTQIITISAKAEDEKAQVIGTGQKALKVGENKYTITVIAEDEAKREYNIVITREEIVEEEVVETIEESKTNSTIIYVVIGFISCLIIILIIRKILKNK